MIRHQWAGVTLVTLLACSAAATCLFALRWTFAVRELQRLQARSDAMARTSAMMQQMAAEAVEYGRRHPEMQALLNQLNQRSAGLTSTLTNATSLTNVGSEVPPPPASAPALDRR